MPTETIVTTTAICLVFAVFGGVLFYVDRIAARWPDGQPAE